MAKAKLNELHVTYKDDELTHNEWIEDVWYHILKLYKLCLNKDSEWHMFFEGRYIILRYSNKCKKEIVNYFENNNVAYQEKGKWCDEQAAVRNNQNIYQKMFNSFSELAIQESISKSNEHLDRVVHCFLNHQFIPLCVYNSSAVKRYGDYWESGLVADYLIRRSGTVGRNRGINDTNEWYQQQLVAQEIEV